MHALDILKERAHKGELGESLKKFFMTSRDKLMRLKKLSRVLMNHVNMFKKGYLHGDFHPNNIGWRCSNRELVVFDFEDVMIDLRFFDIAMYLGAYDSTEKRCDTRYNLAEYYVRQYQSFIGEAICLERFLKEIYVIWLSWKSNPWHPDIDSAEVWKKQPRNKNRKEASRYISILPCLSLNC